MSANPAVGLCVQRHHQTTGLAVPHNAGAESAPVLANSVIDIAAEDGTLFALNAATGRELASIIIGAATIAPAWSPAAPSTSAPSTSACTLCTP